MEKGRAVCGAKGGVAALEPLASGWLAARTRDDGPTDEPREKRRRDMQEEDLEVAIKVVVVGNGVVGKSSLIQRYCRGKFTSEYKKTIGVDFLERELR